MAARKTFNFLPSIFQTDTNRKFLSATLDQLVSEPSFTELNGYIGRKYAPTYKSGDTYISEIDTTRENYQLEPSIVIRDTSDKIEFYSTYQDLINKIGYYGGKTNNHDRLFSSEYYTFAGLFDQDKFINYQQYYWLPNGPEPVLINSDIVKANATFTIAKDDVNRCLTVNGQEGNNPDIVLCRGGVYKFNTTDSNLRVYIQTEQGVSGTKRVLPTVSTRDVYGVTGNGAANGTIEFKVPLIDTQDVYLKMPQQRPVDYAVDITMSDLDGKLWTSIVEDHGGLDGLAYDPTGRMFIFLTASDNDSDWTRADGSVVAADHRRGVWRIRVVEGRVELDYIRDILPKYRIYPRIGRTHANIDFYKTAAGYFMQVPALTAQLDTLYYQDATDPSIFGKIRIVNNATDSIQVDQAILGKKEYTSPAGVEFTNGLVVKFAGDVTPAEYANTTFVVEGVGTAIRLVPWDYLVFPEPGIRTGTVPSELYPWDFKTFDQPYLGPLDAEYICMNRSTLDLNAWARHNRWFHVDVITKAAAYNNTVPLFDQATRAKRPIIEFNADLQLYNNGRVGKQPVDHIDTTSASAFNQVQHSSTLLVNGTKLRKGDRVLFPNDTDPVVRSQIYVIDFEHQNEPSYRSLRDGFGAGTITIEPYPVSFKTTYSPELDSQPAPGQYLYTWAVVSDSDIKLATAITGLNLQNDADVALIQNVIEIGTNLYQLEFIAGFEIVNFALNKVDIITPAGQRNVLGVGTQFTKEFDAGSELYDQDGNLLGTVAEVTSDTTAVLESNSTNSLVSAPFQYKNPRIQLIVSPNPADALEPYDTVVATRGSNAGKTFWYDGNQWHLANTKTGVNQPVLFDVFDRHDVSYSTYNLSKFAGTKLFSYKSGAGSKDPVLGFPISYTNVGTVTNTSIADITFINNLSADTFEYEVDNKFVSVGIDAGYIRKNINGTEFERKTCWSTVNEPTRQYQVISEVYTGKTNHFEIDVLPSPATYSPTLKVFLNNNILDSSKYTQSKVGVKNTIKVSASLLTVGDKIDILIYSDKVSSIGYYQVPNNLDYNSKNVQLKDVTLGQLRNNLIAVGQNNPRVAGSALGETGLRDIPVDNYGGNILQHSAPLIYPQLFLINQQANLIDSIDYARREYTKFKNRFVELCTTLPGLDPADPKNGVDKILSTINAVKNKSFPFYYSDMVPYKEPAVSKYTVLDTTQVQYKLAQIFSDTRVQSRAVLVYHNNRLLVKGVDYTFDTDRPAVRLADTVALALGDIVEIRDYNNTDGNCVPPTPSKLGLYPTFIPSIEVDDTYRNPTQVILGHDGSITPAYNDFRDYYILELEQRIFNNIKSDPAKNLLDVRTLVPGRYRKTDYSLTEFSSILNTSFMKWAGANKIDYIDNTTFVNGDPFTYNYSQSKDILDSNVPGFWRGIYKYYFDTDRPHQRPWEMLGFAAEPTWWIDEYGVAPYTKNNEVLWEDLEAGIIRQGHRAGVHDQYKRPGLRSILPVDESGNLLPPLGTVIKKFNSNRTSDSWKIGDVSPAETAWQRSSEYPFALQAAAALMKPALYFSAMIDTDNYYKDSAIGQYVNTATGHRITPQTVTINGEVIGSNVSRGTGYINWIVDYLTSLGINGSTKVRYLLNNAQVQLSYKLAGYTDKKYLTVLAEQYSPSSNNESVAIPDDSYEIYLNKSVPIEKVTYSAVIIEKTDTGYTVNGYNTNNPYFVIIPSETTGESYNITVDTATATVYKKYLRQKLSIPYGTEFKTKQQIVDFLVSYQRSLFAQGFVFNQYNETLAATQDWVLSAKEFLAWTLQGWKSGSVLVLSPVNTELTLLSDTAVVDQITNDTNGSKVIDTNFSTIKTTELTVLRDSGEFKLISIAGKTIAFAQLNMVQYEHALVFDNTTVFNDIIYKPESGSRQYRLKLVGSKTANWNGALTPEGFMYNSDSIEAWRPGKDYLKGDIVVFKDQYYVGLQNVVAATTFDNTQWMQISKASVKTGLLPSLANNAGKFADIYDIDSTVLDSQWEKMSSGLIGFRDRSYLSDLNVNRTSQTKFYQGYIKQKGTKNAVTNLLNATFNDLSNDVNFFEEWAVRVGEYGATDSTQTVEIALNDRDNKDNPTAIAIIGDDDSAPEGIVGVKIRDLWNKPFGASKIRFINRPFAATYSTDVETAGYVNISDADATIYSSAGYRDLNNILSDISSGYIVWVAKDNNRDWNAYRVSETDTNVTSVSYGLDTVATVTTSTHHRLAKGQPVAIRLLDSRIDGFYVINSIVDEYKFTIDVPETISKLLRQNSVSGTGVLFALYSVRFSSPSEIVNFTPKHGWKDGDRVWVDRSESGGWAVYEKNNAYKFDKSVDIKLGSVDPSSYYGTTVKIDDSGKYIIVGAPSDFDGTGRLHVFEAATNEEVGVVQAEINGLRRLGHSLDAAQGLIVSGAPDSYNGQGAVVIYSPVNGAFYNPIQLIGNPLREGNSSFGYSVSFSRDAKNLYIGDPGNSTVYFYQFTEKEEIVDTFEVLSTINGIRMPRVITEPESLAVYLRGKLLMHGRDWNLGNDSRSIELIPEGYPIILWGGNAIVETESGASILEAEFGLGNPGAITIIQRSYYKLISSYSTESATDRLGWSVKSSADGTQVLVGAPGATVNQVQQAGQVYIFSKRGSTAPTWKTLKVLNPDNPVYRGRFGSSVELCVNTCSAYVGAPGYSDYSYAGGTVYRYVNVGRLLGVITGTATNPTVTVGNSIIINNIEVTFTGTTVASVATDINAAGIAGVQARVENGKLIIQSTDAVLFDKLSITPGVGNAIGNLGIEVFELAQTLYKPLNTQGENFGEFLRLSADALDLAVSSTKGTVVKESIVDSQRTTFDNNATKFLDITLGSGAVYMHNFLPNSQADENNRYGAFVFSEEFNAPSLRIGDQFGSGVDFNESKLIIGAAFNDKKGNNAGNAYTYTNVRGRGWKIVRHQTDAVDVNSINGVSLYNLDSKSKLANLDFIDPIKGKCLGIVEQSLNYKNSRDPAMYNAGSSVVDSSGIDFHWGAQQVGQTWWNLDRSKFVDYEQGDIVYRLNNWGKLFPGSSVEVYEWIESLVLPSNYVASGAVGTPLHDDDSAYVQIMYADPLSGTIKTKYYYWVRGITTVPVGSNRILSPVAIENAIADPKTQGIPYAAILSDNSIAIYNCDKFIVGESTILKVDYDVTRNSNLIHSEFELVKEGDKNSYMPARIVNKLVDSISGIDALSRRVPDPKLKPSQSIGLEVRPIQTLVIDRLLAIKNIVRFVNSVFAETTAAYKIQNSKKFISARFFADDPEPDASQYNFKAKNLTERGYINLVPGVRVLVENDELYFGRWVLYEIQEDLSFKIVQVQTYKTSEVWEYRDWVKSDYNIKTVPDYVVNYYKDLQVLVTKPGDIVRVENGAAGYEIYRFVTKDQSELVAIENGTLALKDILWNAELSGIGFDNAPSEGVTFDLDYSDEIRNVLIGLGTEMFVDDLAEYYNKLMFVIVQYIFTEQKNVDWIFKTSFISVLHNIKELAKYPNYIRDNHQYYEDYINEVKPYRTKIREYKLEYTGTDLAQTDVTDFDLPGYYDRDLKRFRSPSGEYPTKDGAMFIKAPYKDWANNFTFEVENITLTNPGTGYTSVPSVQIVANNDGGTGATAVAVVDELTGQLVKITVTNPGYGYKSTPYVVINGTGTGAKAYANLTNKKIRSLKTTMKFDRVTYTTNVREWLPGVSYRAGEIVSYNGDGYRALINSADTLFKSAKFEKLSDSDYLTANDRIAATYKPGANQIPKEYDAQGNINLDRLISNLDFEGNRLVGVTDTHSESRARSPGIADKVTGTRPEDIRIVGGRFRNVEQAYAPEELVAGTTSDALNLRVSTIIGNDTYVYSLRKVDGQLPMYNSVSRRKSTRLARPLNYNDTKIYLETLNGVVSLPRPAAKVPGVLYINGEVINFWYIDIVDMSILNPIRGVGGTGVPEVHPIGTVVEDLGEDTIVPGVYNTLKDRFVFSRFNNVFTTKFRITTDDIETVASRLTVYNGITPLTIDEDYTISLQPSGDRSVINIRFVNEDSLADGVKFTAEYQTENTWLGVGNGTPADGTGLEGAITEAAMFIKSQPYNFS